jgi:hypothetical protein
MDVDRSRIMRPLRVWGTARSIAEEISSDSNRTLLVLVCHSYTEANTNEAEALAVIEQSEPARQHLIVRFVVVRTP